MTNIGKIHCYNFTCDDLNPCCAVKFPYMYQLHLNSIYTHFKHKHKHTHTKIFTLNVVLFMHQQQHYFICFKKKYLFKWNIRYQSPHKWNGLFQVLQKKITISWNIQKHTSNNNNSSEKKEMRCQFSHPVRTVLQPIHGVFDTHKTERRYVWIHYRS